MMKSFYLEAARTGQWAILSVLLLCTGAIMQAQQVAEIDLRLPPPTDVSPQPIFPQQCKNVPGGAPHGEGVVVTPRADQPARIQVRIISLAPSPASIGTAVNATVLLKNVGARTIEVPGSTDMEVAQRPEYEAGWFWVKIKDASGKSKFLNSLLSGQVLALSSKPSTKLKVEPGEFVTFHLRFALELSDQHSSKRLLPGPAELTIEWLQWQCTEGDRTSCTTGSCSRAHYEQEANPFRIEVLSHEDAYDPKKRSQRSEGRVKESEAAIHFR